MQDIVIDISQQNVEEFWHVSGSDINGARVSPDEEVRSCGDLKQCVKGKQYVKGRQWDRPRVVEVDGPRVVKVERSGKPKTGERKTCSRKSQSRLLKR